MEQVLMDKLLEYLNNTLHNSSSSSSSSSSSTGDEGQKPFFVYYAPLLIHE
jgi:hypothetical protein